jgi:hypothetical protein
VVPLPDREDHDAPPCSAHSPRGRHLPHLTACGGSDTTAEAAESTSRATLPPTTTSAAPTTTTPPAPATNARGHIPEDLGQEAWLLDDAGEPAITFSIDTITVDPTCTEPYYDYTPENGHLVQLQMRVATGADLSAYQSFYFDEQDFAYIGPDNITRTSLHTLPAYACLRDSEQLTRDPLGPNQQYVGSLILDVPGTSGSIIYAPSILGNAGGWEWQF